MFRKLFWTAALAVGVVAFVGTDVVKHSWTRARAAVRESLTANVPLKAQLAEARAQVDAYAEHVIKAEVASDGLARAIGETEREVRALAARAQRERKGLDESKESLTVSTISVDTSRDVAHEAAKRVHAFRLTSQALERRAADLATLRAEYAATLKSLEEARGEQVRLAQEVTTLAAELQSLEARTAAARTRESVGDATVASSGYAAAREKIDAIRSAIAEKDKLLRYYEVRREAGLAATEALAPVPSTPDEALGAIEEALAAYPAVR
jgi:chromosome segregation ATPase